MTEPCCPKCGSQAYKRNGYTRHAKQNHRCLNCGRQFSLETAKLIEESEVPELAEHAILVTSA